MFGKVPDVGKDWGQKEKRASRDGMTGWHHWCNRHELGQALRDGEAQGGLACYSPFGSKESDMTAQTKNNNLYYRKWIRSSQTGVLLVHHHKKVNVIISTKIDGDKQKSRKYGENIGVWGISSVLAWRIPGMGEPGGLPSMGLRRVGHDWSDLATASHLYFCLYICLGIGILDHMVTLVLVFWGTSILFS